MGNDQICPALLGMADEQLGGVGLDRIVRIDKLQVFSLCLTQTHIAGGCHTAVGLVDQHNAGVHLGVHPADLKADILAAIVQQQDLKVLVGLAADALHTARDMILCVINGHNNTYKRLFRHGGGPPFSGSITTIP